MHSKTGLLSYPPIDKIVFVLSALVCVFCYTGQHINIYQFAVIGVIFELAWMPMLALLIILPIISTLLLIKKKVSIKSLPLYSLLLLLTTFLILTLSQ